MCDDNGRYSEECPSDACGVCRKCEAHEDPILCLEETVRGHRVQTLVCEACFRRAALYCV